MTPCHLFVYGTLLTGSLPRDLRRLLRLHCRPAGEAYIHGKLYDLGDYPGAVPATDADQRVYGALLRLRAPGRCLPHLDRYEAYRPGTPQDSEFVRIQVTAYRLPGRRPVPAWAYFYNRPVRAFPPISSGDYRKRRRFERSG